MFRGILLLYRMFFFFRIKYINVAFLNVVT